MEIPTILISLVLVLLDLGNLVEAQIDQLALLSFKSLITSDSQRFLDSWNASFPYCNWPGISCRNRRVEVLDLDGRNLAGKISPHIGNLTSLKALNLQHNAFDGTLPEELGRLQLLERLNISFNSVHGRIPTNLTRCTKLRYLDFRENKISGEIPQNIDRLTNLISLSFYGNLLVGEIPPSIGNITSLETLSLSRNVFRGKIPENLGRLRNLQFIQLCGNDLDGRVPLSLFNVSISLYHFSLTNNRLTGTLPADLGTWLPNLKNVLFGGNEFIGPIPVSLLNATRIEILDISANRLGGLLPYRIGNLRNLTRLNLDQNEISSIGESVAKFFMSLVNCTRLEMLALHSNHLTGILPESIANLSTHLSQFLIGDNHLSGEIPAGIGKLTSLVNLKMGFNSFVGKIPPEFGQLMNLQILALPENTLSGEIPGNLGNILELQILNLGGNDLSGKIPPNLGNFKKLQLLNISSNKLDGTIPKEVLTLSSLTQYLDLSYNSLSGNLNSQVGMLTNVQSLNLSNNELSGNIPGSIGNCSSLQDLLLDHNSFGGSIPRSLDNLKGLIYLDLSSNGLTGEIPESLQLLRFLHNLNLSFNDLDGEVPKEGIFKTLDANSVVGNSKLCGGSSNMNMNSCTGKRKGKKNDSLTLGTIILIILGIVAWILLGILVILLYWRRKTERIEGNPSLVFPSEQQHIRISYNELFTATDGFSEENLMGVGSFGSVYKGFLVHQGVVAVKVLDLEKRGASTSFMAETLALKRVRHKNLVKIVTCCASLDFRGNDFKALVFEFMPNGCLEKWLHQQEIDRDGVTEEQDGLPLMELSLIQRLRIATDVASALDYLHHHCQTPIVHCDLKPSNVLLDDYMHAYLGDFGLARILPATSIPPENQNSTVGLKGTFGYIAPEYGLGGEVTTAGDVYSYGILLLEIFTGKKPTDDMFKDGLNLPKFARMSHPDLVMEIADRKLVETGEKGWRFKVNIMQLCLERVIGVALDCAMEPPKERTKMKDVVIEMEGITDLLLGIEMETRDTFHSSSSMEKLDETNSFA